MKQRTTGVIRPGVALALGGAVLCSLLYASVAAAETKIHEVQPYPIGAPEYLVIWGTDFGDIDFDADTPEIMFGTYPHKLDLIEAATNALCPTFTGDTSGNAPPLDDEGYDCVVAMLPVGSGDPPFDNPDGIGAVPAGDYLLKIWVDGPDECAEKPTSLTLDIYPADCSGFNLQGGYCQGDLTGAVFPVVISDVIGHNNAEWLIAGDPVLAEGDSLVFTGDGKWPNELRFTMTDASGLTQTIQFHTSCSQPLAIGDVFGSAVLSYMEAALVAGMQHDL